LKACKIYQVIHSLLTSLSSCG